MCKDGAPQEYQVYRVQLIFCSAANSRRQSYRMAILLKHSPFFVNIRQERYYKHSFLCEGRVSFVRRSNVVKVQEDDNKEFVERLANQEAAELYDTASKLANDAVRYELQEQAILNQTQQEDSNVYSEQQLLRHLQFEEQFDESQAMKTCQMLTAIKSPYQDIALLTTKLDKLRQLLPGIPLAQIICEEVSFLHVSLNTAVQRMITMSIFFNNRNVVDIISKEPRLLLDEELEIKLQQSFHKLKEAFPGAEDKVDDCIVGFLADSPTTIYRLHYHLDKEYSQLPMDIQNSLLFVGRQAGYVYRAVDGFVDNNTD
eukprot:TRINITY_DN14767_c0_g2_i1.p1 TRINITY_DN14767_c0_g2~~TRINITY_DN14767_c0_g2_i1.p1  ORF type:complete len:314 (+),score=37.94 TRINITY_DN14767_c0_g2_i1:189-1130(+)